MFTCRQVLCWTFQYVQIKHVLWYLSKQGTEDFWNMPVHWRAGEHLEQFLKVTAVWSPCISCRVWLHRGLPPDMRNCAGVGSGWYGGPYAAYAFRHSWAVYGQTNPYTAVLCNRHAGPEFPGCLPVPACQGPNYSREDCEYFAWLIHAAIERSDWLQQRICQTDKRQIFISFFPFSTHPGTGTPASHDFCHACNVQARSPCCTPKVSGAGVKWLKYQKREVLNDWYVKLKEHQLVLPKRDFHAGQTCFNVLMFCCFLLLILLVPEVYWLCAPQPDAWPGKELYRSGNSCWQQKFAFMQASIRGTGMLWQRP